MAQWQRHSEPPGNQNPAPTRFGLEMAMLLLPDSNVVVMVYEANVVQEPLLLNAAAVAVPPFILMYALRLVASPFS